MSHITQQLKRGLIVPQQSLKGKHQNRPNKISDSQRQRVHDHIKCFPAESSHYSRSKNSNRMYLSATLSMNAMYKDYVNRFIGNDKPVSGSMYRSIFCNEFNVGFGSSRSDTCGRCETLLDDALNHHKQSADEAYKQMKIDHEQAKEGGCIFMTYDTEKTMPLPKLSVGEAFYLRQIWMYNVGVHVVRQKREGSYFQIWTETECKRGVNEVCSSHLAFFTIADNSLNKLVVWSDSCAGQNKNFATICFWQYVLLSGRFNTINISFQARPRLWKGRSCSEEARKHIFSRRIPDANDKLYYQQNESHSNTDGRQNG